MEVREEVPISSPATAVEVPAENFDPTWLQLGFEMPKEEEELRALAVEISNRTPSLNNIQFTNPYATSYIGSAILDRGTNIESLASMGEMGVDEATYCVGALISRASFRTF